MAFCSNCGKEVEDSSNFCPSCGKAINKSSSDTMRSMSDYNGNTVSMPTYGANGSVVVIKRKKSVMGFAMPMTVWVDEKAVASAIKNGQEVQLTISNGEHTIRAGITDIETC
jgi:PHP family Zn ribbon phosphoesterase